MIEFLKQKKKIIFGIIIVILIIIYYFYDINDDYIVTQENDILISEDEQDEETYDLEEDIIVVHITGAVEQPGIVKLAENSRIEDAIEAAGGLTEDADITNVNLAYMLDDGIKIKIPSINDEENNSESEEDYIIEGSAIGVEISDETSQETSLMININTATQTELETLPGIGPSLATKIIEYREENGKFSDIEDIKNVSGIGDSKYENIKDLIKVK